MSSVTSEPITTLLQLVVSPGVTLPTQIFSRGLIRLQKFLARVYKYHIFSMTVNK